MQRSTLTTLVVLTTAACGPAGGGDGAMEDGSVDTEGAVSVTSLAPSTAVLKPTTQTAAAATLVRGTTVEPTKEPTNVDRCANYDAITAAIGSLTIDCLGTIGPEAYVIDEKRRLVPRFEKCTQDSTLGIKNAHDDILSLLSIQDRSDEALACISGRYQSWMATNTVKSCPRWKKIETVGAPTDEKVMDAVVKSLPKLPVKVDPKDPPKPPPIPHENYVMEVSYPDGQQLDRRCKDPADCARQCSAGFNGLWIGGEGAKATIDPTYWLISIDFSGVNPFMRADYYHPMSYHGTIPGTLFGHRNREGEACSRFVIDAHVLLSLQLDCLDYNVPTTCVSVCEEAALDTAGTESSESY